MYEEEDDDSTHAYRNLGMLMGTGHQMDRRFYAYYAHQLQMKGIVDQMIQQQQMQLGRTGMPGAGGYPQNQMYSPAGEYMPQQQQQQQQHQPYPLFRQQLFHMPPSYRSSPYPVPQSQGRTMSMHIPQNPAMRMAQQNVGINLQNKASGLVSPVSPAIDEQNNLPRRMSAPPITSAADTIKSLFPETQHFEPSHTQAHQLPSPASEVDDVSFSLFPFTNELPGESARFLQGTGQRGLNNMSPYHSFDIFENTGTTYTTSKGFTTSLSPLQQSNPFDVKTEDGLASTNGELKWQPSKLDPAAPFPNANLGSTAAVAGLLPNGNVAPEDDILSSLFMTPTASTDGFDMLGDCSSLESLAADDTVDNDTWEKFMDQEWLDAATVN
jgi:hypothetical protein